MPICCDNPFQSLYKIVKGAYDCCGNPELDPALEPTNCDSPETLWQKWGCIIEQCACDIVDPQPCFIGLTGIQPPELLVAIDDAGCLHSTLPYNIENVGAVDSVGVYHDFVGLTNTFQLRSLESPTETISIDLKVDGTIQLESQQTSQLFNGVLAAVANNVPTAISVNVPTSGHYIVSVFVKTTATTTRFELYSAAPLSFGQSANWTPGTTSDKSLTITIDLPLVAGVQNIATVLQTNALLGAIAVTYQVNLTRIGRF